MKTLTLEVVPEEVRGRVSSTLAAGEKLSDLAFAGGGDLIVIYKVVGDGILVLGCSDCLGVAEPPSIPFSALTSDETKFTAFADIRLCRTCQTRLRPRTP